MKPGGALMLLLKGKPKGGGDEAESGKDDESSPDEYRSLLETAFPDEDWTDERIQALHEFVHSCMDEG